VLRFIVFVFFICAYTDARDKNQSIIVDSSITWSNNLDVKVNVLLRNVGGESIPFTLLPAKPGTPIDSSFPLCVRRNSLTGDDHAEAHERSVRNPREEYMVLGVVPSHGWAYRSIAVTSKIYGPPCHVPIWVVAPRDHVPEIIWNGVMDVPAARPAMIEVKGAIGEFKTSTMVEKDIVPAQLLVRILIENKGRSHERVLISSRKLICPKGISIEWSRDPPVSQDLEIGPLELRSGKWVVFSAPVDGAGPKVRSYSKRKPEYLLTFGPALSARR
jgi:hypothetical protein